MRSRSPRMVRARIAPSGPVIGHPTPPAAERRVYRETQGKARRLLWLAGLVQCVVSGRTQFFRRGSSESRRVGRRPAELVRKRLQAVFGYASKAALIRNTKGGHLYYILLATP